MLFGGFFLVLLVFLGFHFTQVEITTGHVLELLAVVFAQIAHHPFVDAVREDEYLDPFLAEHFKVRAALGGGKVVAGDVVDLVLAFLHPADVIIQRHVLGGFAGMGGGKAQQSRNFFAVAEVFSRTFFQNGTKLVPEALVFVAAFLGQLGQHIQYPLGQRCTDAFYSTVILQNLP